MLMVLCKMLTKFFSENQIETNIEQIFKKFCLINNNI